MSKYMTLRGALGWSIVLYILFTGMLIWSAPLGSAPDEAAHWDYIAYVAEHYCPPVFQTVKAPEYGYEFHQPPLYYVLNVPAWKAFHGSDAARYCARIFSLICGVFCIVALWSALKALFPAWPEVTFLATLFAGLWPLHQAVGASGSNDALAGLASALLLWIVAKGAADGWKWQHSIWLGILAGLAILTKSSCLVPAVAAFGGAGHLLWRGYKNTTRQPGYKNAFAVISPHIGLALLLTAAIGGWWLVRNQLLYGDPLAMGVFQRAFSQSSPGPDLFFAAGVSVATYLRALLGITFCTFWGLFAGPNTALTTLNPFGTSGPKAAALPALPLILIFLSTSVIGLWGIWKSLHGGWNKNTLQGIALTWWMVEFALVAFSWLQFNTHFFQAQARYFHPALLPIVAGLCYGWVVIWGTKSKKLGWASAIVGLSMIIVTLWNIFGWRSLV